MNSEGLIFIPVGENCVMAENLKIRKLRTSSFPFDWACSNLFSIIEFITKFKDAELDSKFFGSTFSGHVNPELYWPHHGGHLCNIDCYSYIEKSWNKLKLFLLSKNKLIFLHYSPCAVSSNYNEIIDFCHNIELIYPGIDYCFVSLYYTLGVDVRLDYEKKSDRVYIFKFTCIEHWIESDDWKGSKYADLWNLLFDIIKNEIFVD